MFENTGPTLKLIATTRTMGIPRENRDVSVIGIQRNHGTVARDTEIFPDQDDQRVIRLCTPTSEPHNSPSTKLVMLPIESTYSRFVLH